MGFELVFSYHERLEGGGYDKDHLKTLKKRVGKAEEEVPYEKLAGTIMGQLARRDIWVLDVEVFEFTKKKLTFKETKGGLLIGNKKYSLDECGSLGLQEVEEPPVASPSTNLATFKPAFQGANQNVGQSNLSEADKQLLKRRPIRYEIFSPDPVLVDPQSLRSMSFTVGMKYPIFEEKPAGSEVQHGMKYTTVDNAGRKQVINDKYFVPMSNLVGDQFNERNDLALDYGHDGGFGSSMPTLR